MNDSRSITGIRPIHEKFETSTICVTNFLGRHSCVQRPRQTNRDWRGGMRNTCHKKRDEERSGKRPHLSREVNGGHAQYWAFMIWVVKEGMPKVLDTRSCRIRDWHDIFVMGLQGVLATGRGNLQTMSNAVSSSALMSGEQVMHELLL